MSHGFQWIVKEKYKKKNKVRMKAMWKIKKLLSQIIEGTVQWINFRCM